MIQLDLIYLYRDIWISYSLVQERSVEYCFTFDGQTTSGKTINRSNLCGLGLLIIFTDV
jgi:hypothetical protein